MTSQKPSIRTGAVPRYDRLRDFLHLIDNQDVDVYSAMKNIIDSSTGTPQNTTDWSEQDKWIPQILSGEERELAEYLYTKSKGNLH